MEFFKAFFMVSLFAASPFGISWLFEQPSTNMFVGIGAFIAYGIAFMWMTVLVMIGLEEGS